MLVTLSTTEKHETDIVLIILLPPPPSVLLLRVFKGTWSFMERKEVETLGKNLATSHTEDSALNHCANPWVFHGILRGLLQEFWQYSYWY